MGSNAGVARRVAPWLLVLALAGCEASSDPAGADADGADDTAAPSDAAADTALPAPDAEDAAPDDGPPAPVDGPGLGLDYTTTDPGATPRYDPGSADWTATGWPSDRLRGADGHVDLSTFPDNGIELLGAFLDLGGEVLDGFGLNGAVYVQLDGPPDLAALPSPDASRDPRSPVQFVDVTAGSPRYGERSPLVFRWYPGGVDPYYLPGTLAMRPVYGLPLAEGHTYCAVVTRALRDAEGRWLQQAPAFAEALDAEPSLAPLVAWLPDSQLSRADLAVATCFTTQHATDELRRVGDLLDAEPPPEVAFVAEPGPAGEHHGLYAAPRFQAGPKPWLDEGGDIRFDAAGAPLVQGEETMRFLLLVPRDRPMPPAGWPVVIYGHGTWGDYESCRGTEADNLLPEGLAVLCTDQPLHGIRDDGLDLSDDEIMLATFNFLNPRAGRSVLRQGAIDTMILARMVAAGRFDRPASDTVSGEEVRLDPDAIHFFGHSQGAMSGALFLAVEPRVRSAVLSGGGAVLTETILRRKDPVDLATIVTAATGIAKSDLDTFHPLMTLMQMLVDATDPVNYAPYWLHPAAGGAPKHVLVTEGTEDEASPSVGADAMAAAAGVPQVGDLSRLSVAHALRGLAPEPLPVSLNAGGPEAPRTAGLKQWQGGSHFVAFTDPEARALWRRFFADQAAGLAPTLGLGDAPVATTAPVSGADTCEGAAEVVVGLAPVRLSGDTSTAGDASDTAGCPGLDGAGAGARDLAWRLVPAVSGRYRVTLVPFYGPDPNVPRARPNLLSLRDGCATCLAATPNGSLELDLAQGAATTVVVDGGDPGARGAFDVLVTLLCPEEPCGDKACGNAGCAACGACGPGLVCTDAGQCAAPPAGDTCADALPVGALPFAATGETSGHTGALAWPTAACPGPDGPFAAGPPSPAGPYGAASPDVVYRLDAPAAGVYRVRLDAAFDAALYVLGDCADAAGSCLAGDRGAGRSDALVALGAGETAFLVVDGAGNGTPTAGAYTLRVEACVPDCGDRPCGGDGCGGTCGTCAPGERCLETLDCDPLPAICTPEAACEVIAPGDTCADPLPVGALPFKVTGDTTPFYNDHATGEGWCPGQGAARGGGSDDVVYALTAPEAGVYTVTLEAKYDASLYVATDCGDLAGSCLGASEGQKKVGQVDVERVHVPLGAGEQALLFVDGRNNGSNLSGSYTLSVAACAPDCGGKACGSDGCGGTCGACAGPDTCQGGQCLPPPGWSCATPRGVGKLPWEDKATTAGYPDSVAGPCGAPSAGDGSPDVAYRFQAPGDGTYAVRLLGAFAGASLAAVSACDGAPDACLGQAAPGEPLLLDLAGGQQVLLVVDGPPAPAEPAQGGYTLRVEAACFPDCGGRACGDDGCGGSCGPCGAPTDACSADGACEDPTLALGEGCAAPFAVALGPDGFEVQASTAGGLNLYGLGDGFCPGWVAKGRGSADQVWRLAPPEGGRFRVEVAPEGWDALLYALGDCADPAGTCLAASDLPDGAVEAVTVDLAPGEAALLVVDGTGNIRDDAGPYTLRVVPAE